MKLIKVALLFIALHVSLPALAWTNEEDELVFKQTQELAEEGDAKAQYQVAEMYYSGRGVLQDRKSAESWAQKAAEGEYIEAYALLADIYLLSDSYFPDDFLKAKEFATLAVKKGSNQGKISLAKTYINTLSGPTDYDYAIKLLKEVDALQQPDLFRAPLWLGIIYTNGVGVPEDEKEAKYWFDRTDTVTFPGFAEFTAYAYFSEGLSGTITINKEKAKNLMIVACEKGKEANNESFCLPEFEQNN